MKLIILSTLISVLLSASLAFGMTCSAFVTNTNKRSVVFNFNEQGISLQFEVVEKSSNNISNLIGKSSRLKSFQLDFNPKQLLPGEFFRRILGRKELHYNLNDVKFFDDSSLLTHIEGKILSFYLRNPQQKMQVENSEGPLMMVSLDTGRIIAYPKGSIVDSRITGGFSKNLVIETLNAVANPRGEWVKSY